MMTTIIPQTLCAQIHTMTGYSFLLHFFCVVLLLATASPKPNQVERRNVFGRHPFLEAIVDVPANTSQSSALNEVPDDSTNQNTILFEERTSVVSADLSHAVAEDYSKNNLWTEMRNETEEMIRYMPGCSEDAASCLDSTDKRNTSMTDLWRCDCDASCLSFGQCCLDRAIALSTAKDPISQIQPFSCETITPSSPNIGLLVISSCPKISKGSISEAFCQQKVPQKTYSFLMDIPVTSSATKFTYRNYYCALCNDDTDGLIGTNMTFTCNIQENTTLMELVAEGRYIPGKRMFLRDLQIYDETKKDIVKKRQRCKFKIEEHENIYQFAETYDGRTCQYPSKRCLFGGAGSSRCSQQVRTCHPSWPDQDDFMKCHAYSLILFHQHTNTFYKNPHCAKCNFVNVSSSFVTCDFIIRKNVFIFRTQGGPPLPPSFSVLFDISRMPSEKCLGYDQIWDPFLNECVDIACGRSKTWKDGQCINSNTNNVSANSSDLTFAANYSAEDDCPKIALTNIEIYENGSFLSPLSEKWYSEGEYQIFNETVVLVCIEKYFYYDSFLPQHQYTTLIVLVISLICLVLHGIFYLCFLRLRTWHGRNLLCLCCSLFLAQFIFLTGTMATDHYTLCVFISACLHFFWLASFCWMNILSFDIWKTFRCQFYRSSLSKGRMFIFYNLYAWGVPFVIVFVALVIDMTSISAKVKPRYAVFKWQKLCWINSKMGLLCFFLIPVGIIITENLIMFILTSFDIYKQSQESKFVSRKSESISNETSQTSKDKNQAKISRGKGNQTSKVRFALYVKLGILQGLTWGTGFVAVFINSPTWWYIFTLLNGLQGAVIFFFFDLKKWIFTSFWENITRSSWEVSTRATKSTSATSNKRYKIQSHNRQSTKLKGKPMPLIQGETKDETAKESAMCFKTIQKKEPTILLPVKPKTTASSKEALDEYNMEISVNKGNSSGTTIENDGS